jgi:predicted GIY-YIG superfamily endonuclease
MSVYLLHLFTPYRHARHYLGYSRNVAQRVKQHQSGRGVPLMRAVYQAGITFCLARVWDDGDMGLEKQLRHQKNNPRLCPFCSASLPQRSHCLMKSVKKPSTHCDKYGHAWIPSTLDGFEICSNTTYIGGKLVPCAATRKQSTQEAFFAPTVKQPETPVGEQQTLWK